MRGEPLFTTLFLGIFIILGSMPMTIEAGEGQGTAQPGANLSQLTSGKLIFGQSHDPEELLGKVVVVNIGGG